MKNKGKENSLKICGKKVYETVLKKNLSLI